MDCAKCHGRAGCLDSRPSPNRTVRRRYQCLNSKCGLRWSTVERVVEFRMHGQTALELEGRLQRKAALEGLIKTLANMLEQVDTAPPQSPHK